MPTTSVSARYAEYIRQIDNAGAEGMTLAELAMFNNAVYATVYKDISYLEARGRVTKSGKVRDKSYCYVSTGKHNVPTVLVGRTHVSFSRFVDDAIKNVPSTATNFQLILRMVLVAVAARASVGPGESLDYYPRRVKAELVAYINRAETFVEAAKSILDDPRYWNEDQLVDTIDVDNYDSVVLTTLARTLINQLNELEDQND